LFISNLILLVPSLDINTLSPLLLVITLASLPSQSFIFFAKSSTLLGTVLRVPSLQGLYYYIIPATISQSKKNYLPLLASRI